MSFANKIKLYFHKKRLKHNYMAMHRIADAYDCGGELLYNISTGYSTAMRRCNGAIRKINRLDPDANLKEMVAPGQS